MTQLDELEMCSDSALDKTQMTWLFERLQFGEKSKPDAKGGQKKM